MPTDHVNADADLTALIRPHLYGHRCTDPTTGVEMWQQPHLSGVPCHPLAGLRAVETYIAALRTRVHTAAHHTPTAEAVAEGMTGLTMADLPTEEREGWTLTARMAMETLSAILDGTAKVPA